MSCSWAGAISIFILQTNCSWQETAPQKALLSMVPAAWGHVQAGAGTHVWQQPAPVWTAQPPVLVLPCRSCSPVSTSPLDTLLSLAVSPQMVCKQEFVAALLAVL